MSVQKWSAWASIDARHRVLVIGGEDGRFRMVVQRDGGVDVVECEFDRETGQKIVNTFMEVLEAVPEPIPTLTPEARAYWNNVRGTEYFEPPKEKL